MIYKNIFELIGNTPIVEIDKSVHGLDNVTLYSKLEYFNPFGSLKDRMSWEMIKESLHDLEKGKVAIENSSGNTAKALQVIASVCGSHLKTITNRIKDPEKKMILQLLGAEVEELPGKSQCYDPSDPNDPLVHVEKEMAAHPQKYVYTNQYFNEKNVDAHYKGTGKEIAKDIDTVHYFFSGLGTTGSTKGVTKALKEEFPEMKSMGVISSANDIIPGIRNAKEMFEVGLFEKDMYDGIVEMNSNQAIDGSLSLMRKSGVLSGPTGGASYQAVIEYFRTNPSSKPINVVFLACDRFEWYLSYYRERRPEIFGEKPKENSIKSFDSSGKEIPEISPEELDSEMNESRITIVDMRSNVAYKFGHIPGSINIPEGYLEQIVDRAKPFPKNSKVVLLCPNGEKSQTIASYLKSQGVDSYSMMGGIQEWKKQGLPMEQQLQ